MAPPLSQWFQWSNISAAWLDVYHYALILYQVENRKNISLWVSQCWGTTVTFIYKNVLYKLQKCIYKPWLSYFVLISLIYVMSVHSLKKIIYLK